MVIMGICAGVMIVLSLYHSRALPAGGAAHKVQSFAEGWQSFTEVFATFFRKRYIWYYIVFIILYRLAEGLAIKVLPLFLKAGAAEGGMGLTNENYGLIVGTLGTLAFILGSILAGHFVSKKGLRKTLFLLCCTINLPFLLYLLLAIYQPTQMSLTGTAIVCEYFGYGFGFVGLTLFMMQQVAPGKHKMAHYAFASGIMNLGYMAAGMVSGWLSDTFGYGMFFVFVAVAMLPALVLSRVVPFTHTEELRIKS
jgi:PAT family beta-lactamase induction signal transducer AmpG